MSFFNCLNCGERVVRKSWLHKYCAKCAVIKQCERVVRWQKKDRAKNPEKYRAYYARFLKRHPKYDRRFTESRNRRKFKLELEKRVVRARDDLRVHFRVDHSPVLRMPELTCNVCIVRQSKLDCALKLFEENFVQRDVTKGDKPVSSACAVVFAKPLDLVPLETRKAIDWAAAQEEVVREHTKPGDVPRLSPLESLKEWTGRRKRTILKKRKAKTGKRVYG